MHALHRGLLDTLGVLDSDSVGELVGVMLAVGVEELLTLGVGALGVSTQHSNDPSGHMLVPSAYSTQSPLALWHGPAVSPLQTGHKHSSVATGQ